MASPIKPPMPRRAAALSQAAQSALRLIYIEPSADRVCFANACEGRVLAVMQGAIFKGGVDYAGSEFIIGFGMGVVFNPIRVDFPTFYEDNPLAIQPDQVFFLHMILMDSNAGLAMCLGHAVLVSQTGVQRLSHHQPELSEL